VLLEIGHITRPHGLKGEVVVGLVTSVEGRLAPGSTFECQGRELMVQRSQPLPGKAGPRGGQWLVCFEGVGTREDAEALAGAILRAEPLAQAESGADALWVHELIGAEVVGTGGESHGTVTAVEANPASDLLVLDTGALVPLRFVIGSEAGKLTVDVPDGLFDL
jgi:16S rRNA processing protein RimM